MDISIALAAVRRLPPRAAIARESARLRRDELAGSLAVAGNALGREQIDALVDRGIAAGDQRFEQYAAARDLAGAAAWVAAQRPLLASDPRPLLTVEDVRRLHGLATAGQPAIGPSMWRLAVDHPDLGIVSLPPWTIAKETAALVERYRHRADPAEIGTWLAAFLGRFARIRPFAGANGRTARLAVSLLLRRTDAVPLAIPRERATAYRTALVGAQNGDTRALRALIEDALLQGCLRLLAAAGDAPLQPLRELAGDNYTALIKAVKRGRLAAVVRDGRVYTTTDWIADYRAETRRR